VTIAKGARCIWPHRNVLQSNSQTLEKRDAVIRQIRRAAKNQKLRHSENWGYSQTNLHIIGQFIGHIQTATTEFYA